MSPLESRDAMSERRDALLRLMCAVGTNSTLFKASLTEFVTISATSFLRRTFSFHSHLHEFTAKRYTAFPTRTPKTATIASRHAYKCRLMCLVLISLRPRQCSAELPPESKCSQRDPVLSFVACLRKAVSTSSDRIPSDMRVFNASPISITMYSLKTAPLLIHAVSSSSTYCHFSAISHA